ncbi:MAG: peptide chain release factor N(5)-glutamine methyltransferase [Betaproteobacteria bacterium]|nr:peptide chain release factor N(5)-glutamine methyltransferase [Betaproteobacteria bacterium]
MATQNLGQLLRAAPELPPLESRLLLARVLERPRAWLAAHPECVVDEPQAARFAGLCARRMAGEPIAYLLGEREFYGLKLQCSPAALIPRPETELLVDLALARMPRDETLSVLELGTGTGAIALALAQARPRARLCATEIATAALALARRNAQALGLEHIEFRHSDWYANLPDGPWDLIVANPPYIAGGDPHLLEGDLRHEPRLALTPEGDGLDALRLIIAGARAHLRARGALLVEHGWDQGLAVRSLFTAAGFADIDTSRDLGGQERVTGGSTP